METSKSILSRLDAHVKEPRRDLKSMTPMVVPAVIVRMYKMCHVFKVKEKNMFEEQVEVVDEKEFQEEGDPEDEEVNKNVEEPE